MKRNGFTLIELLIVVAIIGLVATIAVPKLINTKERALVAGMKSDLRNLVTAEENYLGDHAKYTTDLGPDYHYSAGNRPPHAHGAGRGVARVNTQPNPARAVPGFRRPAAAPPPPPRGLARLCE